MPEQYRLLLVEDNADYAAYINATLSGSDDPFRITSAGSLRQAGEHLSAGGIDVVLLDLCLPDSDGLETMHRVQAMARGVPIVVLSGVLDQHLAMAAMQAGAQDYLVKSDIQAAVITRVVRYAIERRAAEARLRERDVHYRSLLDQARDAILVRDLDHRVTYFNKSAERIYGWRADDVLGQSVRDRFFPDPAVFDEAMQTLLKQGDWQGEISVSGRDGAKLTVESRWTLMRDAGGAPCAVLVIDTDITERKELERRFLRAQRMESIGTLAGGIAHDLNNMLAPVLMSIELLKEDPTARERDEILATIEASTRRGAEMVRQVLTFARGVDGDRQAVDVANLLIDVKKFAIDTFMKDITVQTVVSGNVLVLGDATQLHQVLINLCVNARDAMGNGGTLSLSAHAQHLAVTEAAIPAGDYVVINVTDTGSGIPAGMVDRIFEPFFTSKATGKGTGLGLSTSLAIVRSHGGFMRVDSEVGRGSTFSVYLPALGDRRSAAPDTGPAVIDRRGAGELVLVVDDEAPVLRMTTLVLESFGYRVLAAASGAEAMALFNTHRARIKVVLTDMTMPGMDGATLIRKVREIDPDTRVIAASGLGANDAARLAGAIRFLPKPYTADTVIRAVTEVVRA